jgi:pimeloyl-ACP methyl ester carboxylesterase
VTGTDLVVVLPGIMGSTLGLAKDGRPANMKLIWAPTAGALWRGVTGIGPNIKDFSLPDGIADQHPNDGVEPVGLMPEVHAIPGLWSPIKGYSRLLRFFEGLGYRRDNEGDPASGNLLPVPYDWRLSNRYNGQRLARIVEPALERWRAQGGPHADAKVVFVCHSMGGLVSRWYIEKCGGAEITRKLITLGTPWRGAAKSLEQLVNGVHPNLGPITLDLTVFSRSLPSTYQLLPEYACIEDGPDYAKTIETTVPELDTTRLADAMALYVDLQAAETARAASVAMTHAIVGTRQPTWTTISFSQNRAMPLDTFGADNDYGDATVPLTGAIGHDQPMDTPMVHRVAEQHGNLQRNQAAFDEIEEILTAQPVRRRAPKPVTLRVVVPDLVLTSDDLPVTVDIDGAERHDLRITITDETGRLLQAQQPRATAGHAETRFTDLPPGAHTITVSGPTQASPISPVTATTLIWDTNP